MNAHIIDATRAITICLALAFSAVECQAQTVDEMAANGESIANRDPLSTELRGRFAEGPAQRGFDIGMAAAEHDTAPGPGKQAIHDSLSPAEQSGFETAVAFSLERNRNADLAARGAAITQADAVLSRARTADQDVFYWLGFDIATGIFGDPALGALGNTATGPGSMKIRDALSPAAQRGFNAATALHLQLRAPSSAGADIKGPLTPAGKSAGSTNGVLKAIYPPVPYVVGLMYNVAEQALRKSNFQPKLVFQEQPDPSVLYGHVRATVPAAGAEPKNREVEVQIPRAASRIGAGALSLGDLERKNGFDLDEGRYEEVLRGADFVLVKHENKPFIDSIDGRTYYAGAGVFIEPSDGAQFAVLNVTPYVNSNSIASAPYYILCKDALAKDHRDAVYVDVADVRVVTICVLTSLRQISIVEFRGADNTQTPTSNGPILSYKFRHALFPPQIAPGVRKRL